MNLRTTPRQHQSDRRNYYRRYYLAHRTEKIAASRKRRCENPDREQLYNRRARLRQRYGLTVKAVEQLYADQNGCCALCLRPLQSLWHPSTCIDHDHTTGKVRGLLHGFCNLAIGFLGHDCMRAHLAALYLCRGEANATAA